MRLRALLPAYLQRPRCEAAEPPPTLPAEPRAHAGASAEDIERDRLAAGRRAAEAERGRAEIAALRGRTWLCGACEATGTGLFSAFAHVHRRTRRPHPVRFAEAAP